VADLNGDGKAELLASCSNGVAIHHGQGSGTFAPFVLADAGGAQGPMVVSDLDGDSDPDVVVADGEGCCFAFSLLRNLGGGGRGPGIQFGDGYYSYGMAIADLEGDGKPELFTINPDKNTLSVFHSADDFHSVTQRDFPVAFYPQTLTLGDLDGDGVDDAC